MQPVGTVYSEEIGRKSIATIKSNKPLSEVFLKNLTIQ